MFSLSGVCVSLDSPRMRNGSSEGLLRAYEWDASLSQPKRQTQIVDEITDQIRPQERPHT